MLQIGTAMTLELNNVNDDKNEKYRCKLVDKRGDILYIDYPISESTGRTGIFLEGTQFKVSFVGKDDSVYSFETEVLGRKKINIPVLLLKYPGKQNMIRIQRRRFVRVESAVDIAIHDPSGKLAPFTTITSDISGGGAAIILPENHHIKNGMEFDLYLVIALQSGDLKYITTRGKVIRVIKGEKQQRDKASTQFLDLKPKDQQFIIRYCFEKQLSGRRKGFI